jgi:hypothetical protein
MATAGDSLAIHDAQGVAELEITPAPVPSLFDRLGSSAASPAGSSLVSMWRVVKRH